VSRRQSATVLAVVVNLVAGLALLWTLEHVALPAIAQLLVAYGLGA
jgi:hypothetical protein